MLLYFRNLHWTLKVCHSIIETFFRNFIVLQLLIQEKLQPSFNPHLHQILEHSMDYSNVVIEEEIKRPHTRYLHLQPLNILKLEVLNLWIGTISRRDNVQLHVNVRQLGVNSNLRTMAHELDLAAALQFQLACPKIDLQVGSLVSVYDNIAISM